MNRPPNVWVLRLTDSQRMALASIIGDAITSPDTVKEYCDVTAGAVTTPGELLALVLNAPPANDED